MTPECSELAPTIADRIRWTLGVRNAYGGAWVVQEVPLDVLHAKVKSALNQCRSNCINTLARARQNVEEGKPPPAGILKWCKAGLKQYRQQSAYEAERQRIRSLAPQFDSHFCAQVANNRIAQH